MKEITFIVPVFNEEKCINKFYKELTSVIKTTPKYRFKIIFVNDGSTDTSDEILESIFRKAKNVSVINLSRNFGHQVAITAGLDHVNSDAAIIIDADLQDPPKVAMKLISKWESGFEVVYAKRRNRKDSFIKRNTAYIFYRFLKIFSTINIPNDTGDFRLVDKKVINSIQKFREQNRYMRGLFTYVGFKQTAILYDRDKRYSGTTHYTFSKMLSLAFNGITGFSTVPLKMIAQIGFLVSFLSFIGIIYAIVMRIFFPEVTVTGWTLMIISILFMGGIQMFTLGIVGIYIGKIYTEVQNRPLYLVSSINEK
jgi:dolichol-phosphate mannosyltransferase